MGYLAAISRGACGGLLLRSMLSLRAGQHRDGASELAKPRHGLVQGYVHGKDGDMLLYMDIHRNMVGLTDEAVVAAHQKDLEVQHKHGVR
jgi:hypothetical protein